MMFRKELDRLRPWLGVREVRGHRVRGETGVQVSLETGL